MKCRNYLCVGFYGASNEVCGMSGRAVRNCKHRKDFERIVRAGHGMQSESNADEARGGQFMMELTRSKEK